MVSYASKPARRFHSADHDTRRFLTSRSQRARGFAQLAILLVAACDITEPPPPPPPNTIGPEGGELSFADGDVTLDFPAGAVTTETTIQVRERSEYLPNPGVVEGTVYEFGPAGLTFNESVELTINFDQGRIPAGISVQALKLYRLDVDSWKEIPGSRVDLGSRSVTAPISGFSTFGVKSPPMVASIEPTLIAWNARQWIRVRGAGFAQDLVINLDDVTHGESYCIREPGRIIYSDATDFWVNPNFGDEPAHWTIQVINNLQEVVTIDSEAGTSTCRGHDYSDPPQEFDVKSEQAVPLLPYELAFPWTLHEPAGGEYWLPRTYQKHTPETRPDPWKYAADFYYSDRQIPGDRQFDIMASIGRPILASHRGVVEDITYDFPCPTLGSITARDRVVHYGTLTVRYTHLKKVRDLDERVVGAGDVMGWVADPNTQDPEERIDLGCAITAHVHLMVFHKGDLLALDDPGQVTVGGEVIFAGPRDEDPGNSTTGFVYVYGAMPRGAQSDLVIENLSVQPSAASAGDDLRVSFVIRNQGLGLARKSIAKIRLSEDYKLDTDDRLLGELQVPEVPQSQAIPYNDVIVTLPSALDAGSYYVGVTVDVYSAANQNDEANDQALAPVTVLGEETLPDLTLSADVSESYTSGEDDVRIPVTVYRSQGNLTRGTYVTARLYFSLNSSWESASDLQLWESNGDLPDYPNSVLNSEGSEKATATVDIPALEEGAYFVLAVVDPTDFHAESDEDNNIQAYPVQLTPGPGETSLAFSFEPADVAPPDNVFPAGFRIYPAVEVEILDSEGNRDLDYEGEIGLELGRHPDGSTLGGGEPVAPVDGVATFGDVVIEPVSDGYTLIAESVTGSGETVNVEGTPFDITTPGDLNLDGWVDECDSETLLGDWGRTDRPPSDINKDGNVDTQDNGVLLSNWNPEPGSGWVFSVQPSDTEEGETIEPPVEVTLRDGSGNPKTCFNGDVTIALGNNPSGATLSGTTTVGAVEGVATFSDLSIDEAGEGFTLVAIWRDDEVATSEPFDVTPPREIKWNAITAGDAHACGITTDGPSYCWGQNNTGELGDGTTTGRDTPVEVTGGHSFSTITAAVVEGVGHTCAVTTAGQAYCWGPNHVGQLGDGTTTERHTPTEVAGDLHLVTIDVGGFHTCAISSDNRAFCWGSNDNGQLGDGSTTDRHTPVEVQGPAFTQITAGKDHTCGLGTDGRAYCWGDNSSYGQLGDGTTTDRRTPVEVTGGHAFVSLSAGEDHTCGITKDDAAYCWGSNLDGQLGDGTTTVRHAPVPVSAEVAFTAIAAGEDYTCSIGVDEMAYCWGENTEGNLGDGTREERHTPTKVSGDLRFRLIAAGKEVTCGITTDGRAYCWGDNSSGQLGDGSGTDSNTPVEVADPGS